MPDPSPWPPIISAAITGFLTGGALLSQTRMNNKRDQRRLEAETHEKEKDRLRAAEIRAADDLFRARSEWMTAYHSCYIKRYHSLNVAKSKMTGEVAIEAAKRTREAVELLMQRLGTLQLIEKVKINRICIHLLTMLMILDRDPAEPTATDRLMDLYLAFIAFGDVLAGEKSRMEAVLSGMEQSNPDAVEAIGRLRRMLEKRASAPPKENGVTTAPSESGVAPNPEMTKPK